MGEPRGVLSMPPAHTQAILEPFREHWPSVSAAPRGKPVVLSWSASRRRWSITSASTVWTHGLWVLYCREGKVAPALWDSVVPVRLKHPALMAAECHQTSGRAGIR